MGGGVGGGGGGAPIYVVSCNRVTKIYLATEIENEIKDAASCC